MMYAPLAFLLIAQPLLAKPIRRAPQPAPAAPVVLSDEQILKNVHLDTTDQALLAFFHQRVTSSVRTEHLAKLAKQLNDPSEAVHAKAMAELVGLGPVTVPVLPRAVNHADNEETLTRARKCLEAIEGPSGSNVVQSVVRLLAARRPEGAVEALLNYLPFADHDTVVQEIETALLSIGVRDSKPESALMRALTDPTPIRRGLAARVLCRIGGTTERKAVRSLLKDVKPSVRMQAALSLSDAHDAEAVPVLIDLVAELPPEGRKRVEEHLTELAGEWAVRTPQGGDAVPMPEAAPRLLVLRRPQGTIEALLAYLPFAESEALALQLADLLASAGCADGKADPALVRALEDKVGTRRAAAAAALCQGKCADALPAVRKLLRDTDVTVRLRTALALAQYGDKSAVPVLIALLADLPLDQVWEAEEALMTGAGDKAPNERVSDDKASRTASVNAWKAWWSKEEKNVDLARLTDAERGNGTVLAVDMQAGRVLEISRAGRIRWQLQGPQWPFDAVLCRNGNVFVAQQNNSQVARWSRQGKELWARQCNMPFACQQLRNGNLFVVCRDRLVEYDANGKEVSSQQLGHLGWIAGGGKYANGHIGLFTQQGQYLRLDAAGKQIKTYQVLFQGGAAMNAEVLPGDRVVATLNIGRVAEYDSKGKTVWESNVPNPACPHRLPNGHTLVAQNGMNHLYELDRKGKIVAEKKDLEYRPWRIRRR